MTCGIANIVQGARALPLATRGDRWCHLSLCAIDAVFSINATYEATWRAARRYAAHAALEPVTAPAADVAARRHVKTEQSLSDFLADIGAWGPDDFAALLGNRQVTSTRRGIRKAEAVQRYARILADHGVDTLTDAATLLSDVEATTGLEAALAAVPGHGSGVRVSYLWMLVGDDQHVKADRMVMRWVAGLVGHPVDVKQSTELVVGAAAVLGVSPWVLDHAIWTAERSR